MEDSMMKRLGRRAGLSAMALAAMALAIPTGAIAQDRGPGQAEMRGGQRGGDGGRFRNMQRQDIPRAPASVENRQWRGNGTPRPQVRGERPGGRTDWQIPREAYRNAPAQSRQAEQWRQQRQGYRNGVQDGRGVEQWRGRRDDRRDSQNAYRNGVRDGRTVEQWRDRRDDRNGVRDGRNVEQWRDRNGWQNGRGRETWQRDGRRNDRAWDRGWRSNSRYDWSSYRTRNRGIYSPGRYYAPQASYRYSRIGIGFQLGSPFFGQRYWINDPWSYRLPDVYGPYRWVRYYDDVVLVDTYSGEVLDVIYDFFW